MLIKSFNITKTRNLYLVTLEYVDDEMDKYPTYF